MRLLTDLANAFFVHSVACRVLCSGAIAVNRVLPGAFILLVGEGGTV